MLAILIHIFMYMVVPLKLVGKFLTWLFHR
jgi:hypothetical protein